MALPSCGSGEEKWMKKAGLVTATAIPGIVFGYALLVGILLRRVAPVPIMAMPGQRRVSPTRATRREPVVA